MRRRFRGHRALGIQQVVVARSQPQANQRARIGYFLRLPAVISLIAPHGVFAGLIPRTSRFPAQIMLTYQRFLDGLRPFGINLLLAARGLLPFAVPACRSVLRFAAVGRGCRTGFRVLTRRTMRRGMSLGMRGRVCSSALRGTRRVLLRAGLRGTRRLRFRGSGFRGCGFLSRRFRGLRSGAAARFRIRSRCLPQCRRSAGTHQRQNATRAQPSSYFRAMLPARFQRQPQKISGQCSVTSGQ